MDERGGSTGVEMALLWVTMLLIILAVVQVALLFYAGQLALTAAQDAVRTGRLYDADPTLNAARDQATSFLDRAAGTALQKVVVTADVVTAGTVRVRVEGEALSLIPGVPLSVVREAVGGFERPAP
ncbi:TadE family protein [Pseudonocardia abyssalis]|uniref:Pilus assembly protein n=1 Tax=Pseudonocardia abyssalis TaxID=2792008 RepID=A0ABS6URS5_9PSEU|nr:TadE family protein [Pseudonocardia abyssalis]MBW0113813.1 pilus assembly protein [Pseudonocardia abyssalis]MBW0134945.1 pilus assembly protein [Pseudonocardia abyssalis]